MSKPAGSTPPGPARPEGLAKDAPKRDLYREVVARADEGVCVCYPIPEHPFVRFEVWNQRMTELTGYDMDYINEHGWYQTLYPDPEVQAAAVARMAAMREGDDLVREEWRVRRADGESRILSMSTCVLSIDGGVARVMALMSDITTQRRAEEALSRRGQILTALADWSERAQTGSLEDSDVQLLLGKLGQAVLASRAYLFENEEGDAGEILTSQRLEWTSPGVEPQLDNPELQRFQLRGNGFGRWIDELGQRRFITGPVGGFPVEEREVLEAQSIRSILVAPIFCDRRWWGFLGFDDCEYDRQWGEAEKSALRTVADVLGARLKRDQDERTLRSLHQDLGTDATKRSSALLRANAELTEEIKRRRAAEAHLRSLAYTDELTGLHNRRGLTMVAEPLLNLARREGHEVALVFADTDHLKRINDTFGHAAGDRALVETAQVLKEAFRDADVVARVGGDEFTVLLLLTEEKDLASLANRRVPAKLAELNAAADREWQLSVSVGVVTGRATQAVTLERLLAEADRQMYAAKRRHQLWDG